MKSFTYKAVDKSGKEKRGQIEAATKKEARQSLLDSGMFVTDLVAQEKKTESSPAKASPRKQKKASPKVRKIRGRGRKIAVFTRQLATMLKSRLPLLRALNIIHRQEKNKSLKSVYFSLHETVRSGNPLSQGLMQYPLIFNDLYINMIRAGEATGAMDKVLLRLAGFIEKIEQIRKKLLTAMIYPALVTTLAAVIVGVLITYIVPKFEVLYQQSLRGASLPAFTRTVMGFSNGVKDNLLWILLTILGLIAIYRLLRGNTKSRLLMDRFFLKIPLVGGLLLKMNTARFSRTFGTLMGNGVPLLEALSITRQVIGNKYMQSALEKVHDAVRDGEAIASSIESTGVFPEFVSSMIDVGEETGELGPMLDSIADAYDEEVDNTITGLLSIVEPMIIIMLAILVLNIVVALFLPIFSITQHL